MTRLGLGTVLLGVALGPLAGGCSAPAGESDETADELFASDGQEHAFRYELPTKDLFKGPLTASVPIELERKGIKVKAVLTPTATLSMDSPVIEGRLNITKRRFWSALLGTDVPKVLDAEVSLSSTVESSLEVDLDVTWSNTERKDVMREISKEIESKLGGGRALALATGLGKTNIPIKDEEGKARSDIPLTTQIDVMVGCSFEEIDGDLHGAMKASAGGKLAARAIYNSEGVEKRRFARDPKKKFELDTSDFTFEAPTFQWKGGSQHLKGVCSLQPVLVVAFDNGVGVRLRLDARSTFDTRLASTAEGKTGWELRAKPSLALWGESDIKVPILHTTLDKDTLLFSKDFPEVVVAVGDPDALTPTPTPTPPLPPAKPEEPTNPPGPDPTPTPTPATPSPTPTPTPSGTGTPPEPPPSTPSPAPTTPTPSPTTPSPNAPPGASPSASPAAPTAPTAPLPAIAGEGPTAPGGTAGTAAKKKTTARPQTDGGCAAANGAASDSSSFALVALAVVALRRRRRSG